MLRAAKFQVGLLSAATTLPFLLIALPAGIVVDRIAKRWLMIGCDAARMVIIASVPLAAAFGALTLAQLYAVALLSGVLTVFFDVAYQSYTPALIGRERLMDGNGKLQATRALGVRPTIWIGVTGCYAAGLFSPLRGMRDVPPAEAPGDDGPEPLPAAKPPGKVTRKPPRAAPRAPKSGLRTAPGKAITKSHGEGPRSELHRQIDELGL